MVVDKVEFAFGRDVSEGNCISQKNGTDFSLKTFNGAHG